MTYQVFSKHPYAEYKSITITSCAAAAAAAAGLYLNPAFQTIHHNNIRCGGRVCNITPLFRRAEYYASAAPAFMVVATMPYTCVQGLTLVPFSAQLEELTADLELFSP